MPNTLRVYGQVPMKEEITIIVPRDKFKELKRSDIKKLITDNLDNVRETLIAEYEEYLLEKREKLIEKLNEMESKIAELRKYYEKALKDNEILKTERERLKRENEELKKMLKGSKR
ncbi:115aa long hypothetical protein [Pyrococcus horikoshii OT3]|uniref:Uncharacterized protein n=2 Tax=Pyrococcus horikoshii TaxID=53953 RepID=O58744_PYRHO|nr:115aa long hypothetical protein [Pyrococcus horikoshii OT3]